MGNRLREWINWAARDDRKPSERARWLADEVGVSTAAVHGYARGEFRPTLENATRIEAATDGFVAATDFVDLERAE